MDRGKGKGKGKGKEKEKEKDKAKTKAKEKGKEKGKKGKEEKDDEKLTKKINKERELDVNEEGEFVSSEDESDESEGQQNVESKGLGEDSNSRFFGKLGKRLKKSRTEEEEYEREMKRRAKLGPYMNSPDSTVSNSVSTHFRSDKPLQNLWFYAETFDDLPNDLHESIHRMKADPDTLADNFTTLLNVLSFADKHIPRRRFVTHAQFARMKKLKAQLPQLTLSDEMMLPPEEAYQTVSLSEARSIVRWDDYLGHGGFGQVVKAKCRDKKDPNFGKKVAVKFVPNKTATEKQKNLAEVSVLQLCNHPNIVKVHRVLDVREEIWIVMELLRGGNLKQASSSKVSPFEEREISYVSREILKGLKYLHSKQIAHRDMKSLNVMLSIDGAVKLVDFGLAVDMSPGPRVGLVGSPEFLAPEMIRGEFYSYPVDIWSFVICILELANQKPREKGNVKRAMFTTATCGLAEPRFRRPGSWSTRFKDFIEMAGTFEPENRPRASELLEHKFIKGACSQKTMKEKLHVVWYLKGHVVQR